jgi:hypothetical protein
MKGFLIFKHALFTVLRNWKEALKIGLIPWSITLIFFFVAFGSAGVEALTTGASYGLGRELASGQAYGKLVFVGVVGTFCALWVAINWHRYVLLEEYPEHWIPNIKLNRIFAYLGQCLLLGLAIFAISLAVMLVSSLMGVVIAAVVDGGRSGAAIVMAGVSILVNLIIGIVTYRMIAVLPAVAVGDSLAIGQAFDATKGANFAIFVLILINFAVNFVLQFLVGVTALASPEVAMVLGLLSMSVLGLTNISVLTTFYGHYVEGREI